MRKGMVQEIAESLGISRVTVWKVLNRKPGVSEEMRHKVATRTAELQSAEAYIQNIHGQGLPHDEAKVSELASSLTPTTVALVVDRPESSIFWMRIINRISLELGRCGQSLLYVYLEKEDFQHRRLPAVLTGSAGQCMGMIVMNVYDGHMLELLSSMELPKVFLDCSAGYNLRRLEGDLLLLDGRVSTATITDEMIRLGHTRVAFIGDINYAQSNYTRWLGYQDALAKYGIPLDTALCLTGVLGEDTHPQQIDDFLSGLNPIPNGIVCANDFIGYMVIRWLLDHGYSVPEQVAVSGYDDNPENREHAISLTTVHVQNGTLGKRLVQQLMFRIENPKADYEEIHIHSKIRWRQSTDIIS